MPISKKNKKRIGFFLLVPILVFAIIFFRDYYIQIPLGLLLTIYIGFIIFLRDNVQEQEFDPVDKKIYGEKKDEEVASQESPTFTFAEDEGFEVVSKNKSASLPAETPTGLSSKDIEEYKKIISSRFSEKTQDEFTSVLNQILKIIRESLTTINSSLFFIYDPVKEKITLTAFDSINNNEVIERKFNVEKDFVSQIAIKNEPLIHSNIPSNLEADNVRYYTTPQGIKSFCGVPYDYNNEFILILAVDSKDENEFGPETVYLLGRYVRLISVLISLFEENLSKKVSSARLNALLKLISLEKPFETLDEMINFFARISENLIDWELFTFISYKAKDGKFEIIKVKNKNIPTKYVGEGFAIELEKSAVGEAIKKGDVSYIPDLSEGQKFRFSSNEKINSGNSFLAVPLIFDGQNYGVVTFESFKKHNYSKNDISFIKKAVKLFTYYIYTFSNKAYLQNLTTLDPVTLVLTKKEFINRLSEALHYENTCDKNGAIALISIDEDSLQESLFDNKNIPRILRLIASYISAELKEGMFIGRWESKTFAVYFFNFSINDATIWAEKVRKKIAQSTYPGFSDQLRYTISVGLVSTKNKDSIEKIMYSASRALEKSIKNGGNKVTSGN